MKFLAFSLMLACSVFALDTKILNVTGDGTKTNLVLESTYQMSERESMENARDHVLECAKQFAVEYVGRKIETTQTVQMIGDAAVNKTKKYILATSTAVASSTIRSEAVKAGLVYHQIVSVDVDPELSKSEVERAKRIEGLIGRYQEGTLLKQVDATAVFNKERAKQLETFASEIINGSVPVCQRIDVKIVYNNIIEKYLCRFSSAPDTVGNYREYYRGEICSVPMKKTGSGSDKIISDAKEEALNTSENLRFYDASVVYGKQLPCNMDYVIQELTWDEYFSVPGFSSTVKVPMIKNGVPIENGEFKIELKRRGSVGDGYDIKMQHKGSGVKPLVIDPAFSL